MKLAPVLVVAAALLAGCAANPKDGYSFAPVYSANIKSVTVPIFENYTYTPELPTQLTDAVIKEMQTRTPWGVTDREHADATLSGIIRTIELRKLSQDPNSGLDLEVAVTVVVDFEFRDNRSGKVILSRRHFAGTDTFVPVAGTGERLEVGQTAAVGRLARDIVSELRTNW